MVPEVQSRSPERKEKQMYQKSPHHPMFDDGILENIEALAQKVSGGCPRVGTLPSFMISRLKQIETLLLKTAEELERF